MSSLDKIRKIMRESRERAKLEDEQFEEMMNKTIDKSRFDDEDEEEDDEESDSNQ